MAADLSELVALGHQAELQWHVGAFHARIEVLANGRCHVHDAEATEDVLPTPEERLEFARASAAADLLRCLRALEGTSARLQIKVNNPSDSDSMWLPSPELLQQELESPRWLPLARRLASRGAAGSSARRLVAVSGLEGGAFATRGVLFYAADSTSDEVAAWAASDVVHDSTEPARDLPKPSAFAPMPAHETHFMAPIMRGLVHALAWMHVATAYSPGEPPTILFDGVRELRLPVSLQPSDVDVRASIDLYEWAAATGDPAAKDAMQQAATFAITDAGDLVDAARPVLRTARSLYELARRGAVTEALATRRAAREAAQASAREAGRAARDAAAKSVERGVLLGLGAAGAVLAKTQDLVTTNQTVFSVAVLALLLGLSLFVALRSEIAVGRDAIDGFRIDADAYREALSREDVEEIRNSSTLTKAEGALDTARKVALGTHISMGVGLALVALLVPDWKKPADTHPAPKPSATVLVPSTSPTSPMPLPTPSRPRPPKMSPSSAPTP